MPSNSSVETADRLSRKRAWLAAAAAVLFAVNQTISRPAFVSGPDTAHSAKVTMWALTAVVLLAILATGGGLFHRSGVRSLINDEVSTLNRRTAVAIGFWVAMAIAMGLYFVPEVGSLSARQAAYLIVTGSTVIALLAFSYLEVRAHRDA
jgi:membrane protein YdbS with pleckstrin-like domain